MAKKSREDISMTSNPTSEAGMYTEAHAALDDLARERIAAAEAKVSHLEALVTALSAQLEGAKEALKPFAERGRQLSGSVADGVPTPLHGISCGDLRLAASTLYGLEGDQEVGSSNASLRTTPHGADTEAEPSEAWAWAAPGVALGPCPMCGAFAGNGCFGSPHPNQVHVERSATGARPAERQPEPREAHEKLGEDE